MDCGVHHIYVETRSWAESIAFWGTLGFELEPGWTPGDGILRCPSGPYVFLREVTEVRSVDLQVFLSADNLDDVAENPAIEVERGPYDAGWGPRLLDIKDPDGRPFVVRASDPE